MPNKPEFHEDLASEHVDPLAPTHQDFDYEQVYRDLDGGPEADWQDDDLNEKLLQFARRILEYAVDTELVEGADRRIGRRMLTLAWVINPALFPGSPSLASLARSIGVDAGTLARLTSEASRTFGITNRAQARWLKRKRARAGKSCLTSTVLMDGTPILTKLPRAVTPPGGQGRRCGSSLDSAGPQTHRDVPKVSSEPPAAEITPAANSTMAAVNGGRHE